jgi:hypothetical protein
MGAFFLPSRFQLACASAVSPLPPNKKKKKKKKKKGQFQNKGKIRQIKNMCFFHFEHLVFLEPVLACGVLPEIGPLPIKAPTCPTVWRCFRYVSTHRVVSALTERQQSKISLLPPLEMDLQKSPRSSCTMV